MADESIDVDRATDAVEGAVDALISDLEETQAAIERVRTERDSLNDEIDAARAEEEDYRLIVHKSTTTREAKRYASMAEEANERARTLMQRRDQLEQRLGMLKRERRELAMQLAATGAALPDDAREVLEE